LDSIRPEDDGYYEVLVGTPAGVLGSGPCRVFVITRPLLLENPRSQTNFAGSTVILSAAATGPGPLHYEWRHDGLQVPGVDGPQLVLAPLRDSDKGLYNVLVRNSYGAVTGTVASVTVLNGLTIRGLPGHALVRGGMLWDFYAEVDEAATLQKQWLHNGTPIPGANELYYQFQALDPSDGGTYTLVVSNEFVAGSADVEVEILGEPYAEGWDGPRDVHVLTGTDTLECGDFFLFGLPPFTARWFRDGQEIDSGEGICVQITPSRDDGVEQYSLAIANPYGLWSNVVLSVHVYPGPSLKVYPGLVVPVGTAIDYSVETPGPAVAIGSILYSNGVFVTVSTNYHLQTASAGAITGLHFEVNYAPPLSRTFLLPVPEVRVVPQMVLQPPLQVETGRRLRILTGNVAQQVGLQASTDLQNWETIATLSNVVGEVDFIEPASSSYRFYRARSLP
jgi:hypothetical protein